MGELICPNCGYHYLASEDFDGAICPHCQTEMQWKPLRCKDC
jgi:hypothetical protein